MLACKRNTSTSSLKPVKRLVFPNPEEMSIEMGITIEQFMCGFTPRIRKNCFSNGALTARIHGRDFGISPAPATYPPVTCRL